MYIRGGRTHADPTFCSPCPLVACNPSGLSPSPAIPCCRSASTRCARAMGRVLVRVGGCKRVIFGQTAPPPQPPCARIWANLSLHPRSAWAHTPAHLSGSVFICSRIARAGASGRKSVTTPMSSTSISSNEACVRLILAQCPVCGNGTRAVLSRNAAGVLTRRNMGKEADYGLLRL